MAFFALAKKTFIFQLFCQVRVAQHCFAFERPNTGIQMDPLRLLVPSSYTALFVASVTLPAL